GEDRTKEHAYDWVQQTGRHRYKHHVVGESPEQVLVNRRDRATGERDGRRDTPQITTYQGYVRGSYRHVSAGADRDSKVSLGQGWSVVDAVADHGDRVAGGLQFSDSSRLLIRRHLGQDVPDANLAGDRLGTEAIVTGQEPVLEPHGRQLQHRLGRGRLYCVCDTDQRAQSAVY